MNEWLERKALVAETQSFLAGYADMVDLAAAELVAETEAYLA